MSDRPNKVRVLGMDVDMDAKDAVGPKARRKGHGTFKHSFKRDDTAISGPITITLFILVVFSVISAVYMEVIPVWVKNTEHQHMRDATNNFINMKRNIDAQVSMGQNDVSIGSPVRMKARAADNWYGITGSTLPGTLIVEVYQNSSATEYMEIYDANTTSDSFGVQQGYIKFVSNNVEYQDMDIIYENGAVIVLSGDTGVVKAEPNFRVTHDGTGNKTLTFTSISLRGQSQRLSTKNDLIVQTRLQKALEGEFDWSFVGHKNINITVQSDYAQVWETYFNANLNANKGLTPGTDFNVTRSGNSVTATINDITYMDLSSAVIEVALN